MPYAGATVRTTQEGEQVGPKMYAALRRVDRKDAIPSRNQLAVSVGPHGSQDYGYRIVNRCTGKGLLELDPDHPDATPQGEGAVVLTEKGKRFLAEHSEGDA